MTAVKVTQVCQTLKKWAIEYVRSVVTKKVLLLVPVLFSSLGITGGGFHSGLGVSSSSPPSSSMAYN